MARNHKSKNLLFLSSSGIYIWQTPLRADSKTYLSIRYLVRPAKPKAAGEISSILNIMPIKAIILFLLAVCFQSVIINEASKEDLTSVQVRQEKLEMQSKCVFVKLQKNHETLKNALKSIDRKQRIVPSKYIFVRNSAY